MSAILPFPNGKNRPHLHLEKHFAITTRQVVDRVRSNPIAPFLLSNFGKWRVYWLISNAWHGGAYERHSFVCKRGAGFVSKPLPADVALPHAA